MCKFEPVNVDQNKKYIFSNGGYAATARLNFQYFLFGAQAGYQLSPSIPLKKENLMIADVGTGTAIWLVDLSRNLPATTTLHGLDVKTDLLPRSEWMPPNLSFHTLDVFEPVPEQYVEKYDIEHIRLFVPVVQKGDPIPVLKNTLTLLKPGGYLQWDERDLDIRVSGQVSSETGAMETLISSMNNMVKSRGRSAAWVSKLDEYFKSCGLEVLSFNRHPTPKAMLGYHQDLILQTIEESTYGLDRMQMREAGHAMREKINDGYEEYRTHGTVSPADLVVCIGRKAGKMENL